ncbi:MAG: hypothetical protein QOD41_4904 [Cryptosporangiaceae bacterium]|jgi:Tol biopolymer transport system component|nr:hypothetical protein [Cryptosporangiaceae bacterium]
MRLRGNIALVLAIAAGLGGSATAAAAADVPDPAATVRASIAVDGTTQGDDDSFSPSVSADGRYVTYFTWAGNLTGDGQWHWGDLMLFDTAEQKTTVIADTNCGFNGGAMGTTATISADGRYVAFDSPCGHVPDDTDMRADIYVWDRLTGTFSRIGASQVATPKPGSTHPAISADGRFTAFESVHRDVVPSDTNWVSDVFLTDRQAGTTARVSVNTAGKQANGWSGGASISGDGKFVVFESDATNLVANDTNGKRDVFLRDVAGKRTVRLSGGVGAAEANGKTFAPRISADGKFVTFGSEATNLVPGETATGQDQYLYDRKAKVTRRIAPAGAHGYDGSPSGDGRLIAFSSPDPIDPADTNGSTDVYVYDRVAGTYQRVSAATDGSQSDGSSFGAALSEDGGFVAYSSDASTLVPGDTNGKRDVFRSPAHR